VTLDELGVVHRDQRLSGVFVRSRDRGMLPRRRIEDVHRCRRRDRFQKV
jgi:hypothetical protein